MTVHEAYRCLQAITGNWKALKSEAMGKCVSKSCQWDNRIEPQGLVRRRRGCRLLTAKLDGASLVLGTYMAEGKRLLQQVVL